jgi:hypothetical protein
VSPVIYTHSSAKTRPSVSSLLNEVPAAVYKQASMYMQYLAAHSKPFRGRAWRNNQVQKKIVRFYDEREWRYVPHTPRDCPLFLDWKDYKNDTTRKRLQGKLREHNTLRASRPAGIQAGTGLGGRRVEASSGSTEEGTSSFRQA